MHAALKRKGKGDDVVEDDMNGFISAHNCESSLQSTHLLSGLMQ